MKTSYAYGLAALLVVGWLVWLLAPVLTPFAVAALLAYLGDPLADRLEAWKFSRTWAVIAVFGMLSLLVVFLLIVVVPMLGRQASRLVAGIPSAVAWFQSSVVPWLTANFGVSPETFEVSSLAEVMKENWVGAGNIAATVLLSISKSGMTLFGWAINLVLIPVVTFYLLRDWDTLTANVRELLPRMVEPTVSRLAAQADGVLAAFLRGQLLVMTALGTIYTLGLWAVGIDLALLIGAGAGVISFIPYLGTIVGLGAGLIAAWIQFGDLFHIGLVGVVFGIGQALEGMVLTPLLVGDRIGLHPVAVIFAVMAFGQLFGFLGVLLALPAAAVIMVLIRYAHDVYIGSGVYGQGQRKEQDDTEPDQEDPALVETTDA